MPKLLWMSPYSLHDISSGASIHCRYILESSKQGLRSGLSRLLSLIVLTAVPLPLATLKSFMSASLRLGSLSSMTVVCTTST